MPNGIELWGLILTALSALGGVIAWIVSRHDKLKEQAAPQSQSFHLHQGEGKSRIVEGAVIGVVAAETIRHVNLADAFQDVVGSHIGSAVTFADPNTASGIFDVLDTAADIITQASDAIGL